MKTDPKHLGKTYASVSQCLGLGTEICRALGTHLGSVRDRILKKREVESNQGRVLDIEFCCWFCFLARLQKVATGKSRPFWGFNPDSLKDPIQFKHKVESCRSIRLGRKMHF